jgi:hypothetical protein
MFSVLLILRVLVLAANKEKNLVSRKGENDPSEK